MAGVDLPTQLIPHALAAIPSVEDRTSFRTELRRANLDPNSNLDIDYHQVVDTTPDNLPLQIAWESGLCDVNDKTGRYRFQLMVMLEDLSLPMRRMALRVMPSEARLAVLQQMPKNEALAVQLPPEATPDSTAVFSDVRGFGRFCASIILLKAILHYPQSAPSQSLTGSP